MNYKKIIYFIVLSIFVFAQLGPDYLWAFPKVSKQAFLRPPARELTKDVLLDHKEEVRQQFAKIVNDIAQKKSWDAKVQKEIQSKFEELLKKLALKIKRRDEYRIELTEGEIKLIAGTAEHTMMLLEALFQIPGAKYESDETKRRRMLKICGALFRESAAKNLAKIEKIFEQKEISYWIALVLAHDIDKYSESFSEKRKKMGSHDLLSYYLTNEYGLLDGIESLCPKNSSKEKIEEQKDILKLAVKYHVLFGITFAGEWTDLKWQELLKDEDVQKNILCKENWSELMQDFLNCLVMITLLDTTGTGEKGFLTNRQASATFEKLDDLKDIFKGDGKNFAGVKEEINEKIENLAKNNTEKRLIGLLMFRDDNADRHESEFYKRKLYKAFELLKDEISIDEINYFWENFHKVNLRYANYLINSSAWIRQGILDWIPAGEEAIKDVDLFKGRNIGYKDEVNTAFLKFLILLTRVATDAEYGEPCSEIKFVSKEGLPLHRSKDFNEQLRWLNEAILYLARGFLFYTKPKFKWGEPFDPDIFADRTNDEKRENILENFKQSNGFVIEAPLRVFDGATSSLDFPEIRDILPDRFKKSLQGLPVVTTISSNISIKMTFKPIKDKNIIKYQFKYGDEIIESRDIDKEIELIQGKTPKGYRDAPDYIFKNVFKIPGGVEITYEYIFPGVEIAEIIKPAEFRKMMEYLESVGVSNLILFTAGSILSGADLRFADICDSATKIQKDEFNTPTGGQGTYPTMLGGVATNLSMLVNWDNKKRPAVFLKPLIAERLFENIGKHMLLIFPKISPQDMGKDYSVTNFIWLDLVEDKESQNKYAKMADLGIAYTQALKKGDFKAVTETVKEYVEIRDWLCQRWMNLMLDAMEDKDGAPEYAYKYLEKFSNDPDYQTVKDLWNSGADLRNINLYTYGIKEIIEEAWQEGIAIMPIGPGGMNSPYVAVSSKAEKEDSLKHLKEFFAKKGLSDLSNNPKSSPKGYLLQIDVTEKHFEISGLQGELKPPLAPYTVFYHPNQEVTKDINSKKPVTNLPISLISQIKLLKSPSGEKIFMARDGKALPKSPVMVKSEKVMVVKFPSLTDNGNETGETNAVKTGGANEKNFFLQGILNLTKNYKTFQRLFLIINGVKEKLVKSTGLERHLERLRKKDKDLNFARSL
ncbi:MAG: hypothetical protein ABII74_00825 [Elusimicrobiota bacterium]